MSKEIVALSLLSLCKLYFYNQLIDSIKKSIKNGNFVDFEETFLERYRNEGT